MEFKYFISRIETSQFAMFNDKFNSQENVNLSTSHTFVPSNDCNSIKCVTTIQFSQNDSIILILELNCYFVLDDNSSNEIRESMKIPVDFLRYMGTISVGAARGVIHAKTEGAALNGIVLPPINLVEAIKEDMVLTKREN